MREKVWSNQTVDHAPLASQNNAKASQPPSQRRQRGQGRTPFATPQDRIVKFVDGYIHPDDLLSKIIEVPHQQGGHKRSRRHLALQRFALIGLNEFIKEFRSMVARGEDPRLADSETQAGIW